VSKAASPRAPRSLDFFSYFEGTTTPYPLAIFRIAFYLGLAIHFFPSLVLMDDAFSPRAVRSEEWNHWLYLNLWRLPHGLLRAGSFVTMAGCAMGLLGIFPRTAAILAGIGCYVFASFNGLAVHTLAIVDASAVLLLFMLLGGGDEALSLTAVRRGGPAPHAPRLVSGLILYSLLLAVFFAGVEKILAGWPGTNEMGVLLNYPRGFLVRDWVWGASALHGPTVTGFFSWFTVLVELGAPVGLLFRRTRLFAFAVYQTFFLGIVAMLEVPPLFYFMFAGGAVLALDENDLRRLTSAMRSPFPTSPARAPD
jgi:hypothetical protein